MAGFIQQVALALLAMSMVSWARRPYPGLWVDRPDALDDEGEGKQAECFTDNCALAEEREAAAAFPDSFDSDLDVEEAVQGEPPTADKRNDESQPQICDRDQSLKAVLRKALSPCECEQGFQPLQMGEAHFPRHLLVMKCLNSKRCRTRTYRVPILTRRSSQDVSQPKSASSALVPESLSKHWRFEFRSLPVACDCVL